jgi:hypothetical protein
MEFLPILFPVANVKKKVLIQFICLRKFPAVYLYSTREAGLIGLRFAQIFV